MGRFVVAKQAVKQTAELFCPWTCKTLRENNSKTTKPFRFRTASIRLYDRVRNFFLRLTEITLIDLML